MIYTVIHVWGGLLQSVFLYSELPPAEEALKSLFEPCDCDDVCESYQEAFLLQADVDGSEAERLDSTHSPSKGG